MSELSEHLVRLELNEQLVSLEVVIGVQAFVRGRRSIVLRSRLRKPAVYGSSSIKSGCG